MVDTTSTVGIPNKAFQKTPHVCFFADVAVGHIFYALTILGLRIKRRAVRPFRYLSHQI
jgi:hypothetical protein